MLFLHGSDGSKTQRVDFDAGVLCVMENQASHLSASSAMKPATLRTPAASACCCCSYTTGSTDATSRRSSTACSPQVLTDLDRAAASHGDNGQCEASVCIVSQPNCLNQLRSLSACKNVMVVVSMRKCRLCMTHGMNIG